MADEPPEDVWPSLVVEFELKNARVVATLGDDGGAIVEQVPRLYFSEGRLVSFEMPRGAALNLYEYNCHFGVMDEGDPMASSSSQARIVISGVFSNGLRLEIRGDGWIGYDDKGNLEGCFDSPPVMIRESEDPEGDEEAEREAAERAKEYVAGLPASMFDSLQMPPQYNQATVRVPPHHDESLD